MATKWAEYKRKQREKAKLDLGKKESVGEVAVPRTEMTAGEIHTNDVVAEVNDDGVVLVQRRCNLCERTWGSTIPITCPYCHGRGVKP